MTSRALVRPDSLAPRPRLERLARLGRLGRNCGGWVPVAVAAFLLVGTRQAYTVPYTGLGLSPAQLIFLLLGATWVLTRLTGQRYPLGLGLLSGLIVVRLCLVLISYGLASGRPLTPDQRASGGQVVVVEAAVGLLVIVTATLLRSRRDVEMVLRALVVGGALSGTFALTEFLTGADVAGAVHLPGLSETIAPSLAFDLVRQGVVRSAGAAAQPLELAAVVTTLLPIAAACFFSARARGERSWPWALAAALMSAGAIVSLSRSVFVGLGAAALVVALRWPARRSLGVVGVVAAAVLVAVISGSRAVGAVITLLTKGSDDFSLGSREEGRSYVLTHVTDHFWWGQGPGTYDLGRQPVLDNQYLSQLMETGVLGLLASVGVLGCALWYALAATSRRVDGDLRELAVGVSGALVAVVVIQLVLDTAGFVQIGVVIWLYVGLAAAVWRIGIAVDPVVADPPTISTPREALRPGAAEARSRPTQPLAR